MSTGSSSSSSDAAPPRAVRFSPWSEMAVVPSHETPEHDRWHARADYASFRKQLVADVRRSSRVFASTPADKLTEDELEGCVGIESFLHLDLARHLQERKAAHVRAVVAGQRVHGAEELAAAAEGSSRWARDGARCRARGLGGRLGGEATQES